MSRAGWGQWKRGGTAQRCIKHFIIQAKLGSREERRLRRDSAHNPQLFRLGSGGRGRRQGRRLLTPLHTSTHILTPHPQVLGQLEPFPAAAMGQRCRVPNAAADVRAVRRDRTAAAVLLRRGTGRYRLHVQRALLGPLLPGKGQKGRGECLAG